MHGANVKITFCDVHMMPESPNDAFPRTYPRRQVTHGRM